MIKSWIPNALSLGNLALGFLAILISVDAQPEPGHESSQIFFFSGLLILLASILDGFDGTIARWLKVESEIGAHLDTLADMTTFGLAPAFLMYIMFFNDNVIHAEAFTLSVGAIIAVIYPLSAAFRLARFQVAHAPEYFQGLPTPIAGAFIALIAIVNGIYKFNDAIALVIFLGLTFLMSSNIKYAKPQISFRKHMSTFRVILLTLVLLISLFWVNWYWTMLA